AVIIALFLGGIGVHKFYLGKVGMGILYLIFCWTLLPAIIAFFEGIIYLCTSDEDFAKKYG
ncbi:TM2 domain-containing protein, partial [Citrobacter freundii]|uniref:TM2 domain-containing protein n=1 Tax=Citrobacter freundii TaxID=546 RepID=UPI00366B36F2